jgi:hypothetical protein
MPSWLTLLTYKKAAPEINIWRGKGNIFFRLQKCSPLALEKGVEKIITGEHPGVKDELP